jgi:hypothetical protein
MKFHIRPARPEEAGLFYTPHPEEDKRLGTVGHVRMDFGRSGNEFWHTWWPRGPEELNSPAFKLELQEVVDTLRESVLKNRFAMERFCYEHGGKISGGWTQNYGYIVETEHYRYCLRSNPSPGDYNGYCTAYDLAVQRQNMARDKPLVIEVEGELIGRPYVEITLNLMERFGVRVEREGWSRFTVPAGQRYTSPGRIAVEGDASTASYFLAAGALGGGPVRVVGAGRQSIQGDVKFADALAVMGGMLPFLALPALFGSRLPVRLGVFAENRAVAFLGEYAFLADYQLFEAGKLSFTLLNEVAANPALPRCVRSPEFHIYPPGTRPKENYASL